MIGKKGPFPEIDSHAGKEADEAGVGFIRSSQAVGAGHEDYDGRDAIRNSDFPNEESGEGKDDTPQGTGVGF